MSEAVPDWLDAAAPPASARGTRLVMSFHAAIGRALPDRLVRGAVRLVSWPAYRRFRAALRDPRRHQEHLLRKILRRNRGTVFGREHAFDALASVGAYQARVPVRRWDQFEPYVERIRRGEAGVLTAEPVEYFATTSGTTGRSKHIPVTRSYRREYGRYLDMLVRHVLLALPGVARGYPLMLMSATADGRTPAGIPYGHLTRAVLIPRIPFRGRFLPIPLGCYDVADFDSRYYLVLRLAIQTPVSCLVGINPSTVVLLCQRLDEWAERLIDDVRHGTLDPALSLRPPLRQQIESRLQPDPERARVLARVRETAGGLRAVDAWPGLTGVICWKGGSAPFFLRQLERYVGSLPVMELGYIASEGAFTVPLDARGSRGVFSVLSHFCEFLPEADRAASPEHPFPRALLCHELELGRRYYPVVTGSHGLYRYDIDDVVEVVGFVDETPELAFLHKGSRMLNVTGEKVGESHVTQAVTRASARVGVPLAGFTVTVRLSERPRYVFAVEPAGRERNGALLELLAACDQELQRANQEYEVKRASGRLGPPVLLLVRPGAYLEHRRRQVERGAPDTTVKAPHLVASEEELGEFPITRALEPAPGDRTRNP